MLYHIVTVCMPLLVTPIISRRLGALQLGVYSYTYAIAFYFYLFGMLGVKNYGSRSIARVKDNQDELNRTFSSIFSFQIISSLIMFVAYAFYSVVLCKKNILITYIQGILVFSSAFDISWLFFGLEMFKTTAIRNILVKAFSIILIILFVCCPSDLWKYTLIMASGSLFSQVTLWPLLRKNIKFIRPDWESIFSHFKPNLILFIQVISVNIFEYMDKIMLGLMVGMSELGYYASAEKLIQIPNSLVTALGTVMLPRISSYANHEDKNYVVSLTHKSMLISVFACSAITFGIIGVADVFVPFFFGEDFTPAISPVRTLAPMAIFISWGSVIRTQYLLPQMKDLQFLISTLIACGVNLIANYLCISVWGAQGAAIGTVCSEFLLCFIQTCMASKALPIRDCIKSCFPFIVFGIIMCLAIYRIDIGGNVTSFIIRFSVGAFIYLFLAIIYIIKYIRYYFN